MATVHAAISGCALASASAFPSRQNGSALQRGRHAPGLGLKGLGSRQQKPLALPPRALPLPSPADLSLVLDSSMLAFVSAELPEGINYTIQTSDFRLSQEAIKTFYMIFSCVFCWGAVVFGSMNDAFYDSDEYRNAGGNGTQFYIYEKAEEEEEAAREELWRDELRQEIEEKMGEIKELQSGEEEKAKEVV